MLMYGGHEATVNKIIQLKTESKEWQYPQNFPKHCKYPSSSCKSTPNAATTFPKHSQTTLRYDPNLPGDINHCLYRVLNSLEESSEDVFEQESGLKMEGDIDQSQLAGLMPEPQHWNLLTFLASTAACRS